NPRQSGTPRGFETPAPSTSVIARSSTARRRLESLRIIGRRVHDVSGLGKNRPQRCRTIAIESVVVRSSPIWVIRVTLVQTLNLNPRASRILLSMGARFRHLEVHAQSP